MNQQTSAILAEFEHFLHEQNTVRPNQRPFYVQWVKRYLSFVDTEEWLPEGDTIPRFLNSLRSKNRFADWQINQAMDAIICYLHSFLPHNESSEVRVNAGKPGISNWPEVEIQVKEIARLRHYSLSTERTYSQLDKAIRQIR